MRRPRSSGKKAGYSLIEMMVVTAIGSIISLGMVTFMLQTASMNGLQKYNSGTNDFHDALRDFFRNPDACFSSLNGIPLTLATNQNVPVLTDTASLLQKSYLGTTTAGGAYDNGAGVVTTMTLHNYSDSVDEPQYGTATLTLVLSSLKSVPGSSKVVRDVIIRTKKNAANALIYCEAMTRRAGMIWQHVNGTDLQFNGGNLGVGRAAGLIAPLHVAGKTQDNTPVLAWGAAGSVQSALTNDQGGAIELGALAGQANSAPGGVPYIDFHYGNGLVQDYNMRLINDGDGQLSVHGLGAGPDILVASFEKTGELGVGQLPGVGFNLDAQSTINSDVGYWVGGVMVINSSGKMSPSDIRLKQNVKPLPKALDHLRQLQGVSYNWKKGVNPSRDLQIGFIAQDVETVYPEVVVNDKRTGMKSIAYDHLLAPVVESIRAVYTGLVQLESQMDAINAKNAQLKKENLAFKQRLSALEQKIGQ